MNNLVELMTDVLANGEYMPNRTGVATYSVVSRELRWDLSKGFPAVTGKKLAFGAVIGELLWFLSGSSSILELRSFSDLSEDDFCIWQKNLDQYIERQKAANINADIDYRCHELGYVYGWMWRSKISTPSETTNNEVAYIDQIQLLINSIMAVKENPSHPAARRLIVDAWDAGAHTDDYGLTCALPPCHYSFQCFVRNGKLSLKWNQRSVDIFLGLCFNIASYAALVHILAKVTGLEVGELIFSGGDCHIYENHVEQVKQYCRNPKYNFPTLVMPEFDSLEELFKYTAKDFKLQNYKSNATIKAVMS